MNPFASTRNPVFYIAEIGGNHEGDFGYARRLAELAIESGADAIKYQIYSGDTLVSAVESPERNKHFKKFELSIEQYIELAHLCQSKGRMFMASVWDAEMLAAIDPYLEVHKIGSGDLTCYPIIRKLVATGKPIILSTGLSTYEEIAATVEFIRGCDARYVSERKLALLQCTSSYPTPDEDANLDVIPELARRFGLPVGFSDHTLDAVAVEASVALGATIIEKHFTDTREGKTFRDHKVSLTCAEVQQLLARLARIRVLKGSSDKRPTPAELAAGHTKSFRRSVYAARDIAAGEVLDASNLTILRPEHGLSATEFEAQLGRRTTRALRRHEALKAGDVS
jgi:N,N'-diacetyllegionaminate synthase